MRGPVISRPSLSIYIYMCVCMSLFFSLVRESEGRESVAYARDSSWPPYERMRGEDSSGRWRAALHRFLLPLRFFPTGFGEIRGGSWEERKHLRWSFISTLPTLFINNLILYLIFLKIDFGIRVYGLILFFFLIEGKFKKNWWFVGNFIYCYLLFGSID